MAWEARWGLKHGDETRLDIALQVEMAWEARWRVGSILTVEWSGSLQYLTKTVLPFVGAGLAQVAAGPVRGMEFARASARPQPLSGVGFLGVVGPSMSGVLPYPRANVRPLPLTTQ